MLQIDHGGIYSHPLFRLCWSCLQQTVCKVETITEVLLQIAQNRLTSLLYESIAELSEPEFIELMNF
jgi:hypothetical protein